MLHEASDWATAQPLVDAIRVSAQAADGVDPLDEAAHLLLKHHGLSQARLWLAEGGFALVHGDALELAVAAEARGHGVGLELAVTAARHAEQAWSHINHPAAARIADRIGWERVRELWVLRRPASIALPARDPGPTIRSFASGDEPAVLAINAAAFAHHPEQGSMSAADLAERMAEPWFDPSGLLIAEVEGAPVGFHWTKQHDADHGEVYVIGIAPAGQGRGLGRALTIAGLEHLHALGVSEVLLYVESDNEAARRLYEGLGFEHAARDTHVQYARVRR